MKKLKPVDQWRQWTGDEDGQSRLVRAEDCGRAAEALIELQARPGVLVLDDLAGFNSESSHGAWEEHLGKMADFFDISRPVLPVHKRHATESADDLLPLVRSEIERLARPVAAIVDMQWVFTDVAGDNCKARWFGLELIRLIKKAKPSLPIFVWSPIEDKQIMQRAMQLGASSCFNKQMRLTFQHDLSGTDKDKDTGDWLDVGKLWFRLLEWEATRYQCPPVGGGNSNFLLAETPETERCRKRFLKVFKLTESDLLKIPEPDVERLLRALVPDAVGVEILRFFGEGLSSAERPFVVRGHTASGRWLRPVQIKLSKDWRALAREGKGYRDVFAGSLGPSVAHVVSGPYRLGEWCGMAQSFAAPEEAIRDIGTKSTRSLEDWLRKELAEPEQCRQLVDEVFDGVLDPLYKGNLQKSRESALKAFNRVSPIHLSGVFIQVLESIADENQIDLTPEALSRKDEKARREVAYRRWKKVEDWLNSKADENNDGNDLFVIRGMVIDTLEVDDLNPLESRLRLLDPTLGVKVDLEAGTQEVARRWRTLAESHLKLVGLPVSFAIKRDFVEQGVEGDDSSPRGCLLSGWTHAIRKLLLENGILEDGKTEPVNKTAWKRAATFFHPCHPLDWSEEFHVGPTHGDLNLGNILLHEKGKSQFPWLIDFDKAEDKRPVVFDLAKLEIEAYHKIVHELFWELREIRCLKKDSDTRGLLRRFEAALETRRILDVNHLWEEFEGKGTAVPDSIKNRFAGIFAYFKQVYKRVEDLGIKRKEFLVGRAVYALCCLKFKHLYKASVHPNAPFPVKILLWKLEFLLESLDAENGIVSKSQEGGEVSAQQAAIRELISAVREARIEGKTNPLDQVLKDVFSGDEFKALKNIPFYEKSENWETLLRLLRLLRDKQILGSNRWMRELLWYARDCGVAEGVEELGMFTKAMVLASMEPGSNIEFVEGLVDYASTGRLGNTYPTAEMFKHLAEDRGKLIKVSSRGESGGTIDILEEAGIPICRSKEIVECELKERGWVVVETSPELCEVDKILMKIRREAGCMKVSDLAMASISAKKAALGIPKFDVQVVGGYDAKFAELLESSDEEDLKTKWTAMWMAVDAKNEVTWIDPVFESDSLMSWFDPDGAAEFVVFGKSLLAAKVWGDLEEGQRIQLRSRLPEKFCDDLGTLLGGLKKLAENLGNGSARPLEPLILNLEQIQTPTHLKGLVCGVSPILADKKEFRDLSVMVFKFTEDVRELVHVPFFDNLYSEISKSGHPLAALIFGKKWLAVLRPQSDLPSDLQAWCWKILREGFDEK